MINKNKSEKLLEAFGHIEDELIEENLDHDNVVKNTTNKKSTVKKSNIHKGKIISIVSHRIAKWGALAACFLFLAGIGLLNLNQPATQSFYINNIIGEMPTGSQEYYDPKTHKEVVWTLEQTIDYYGRDFTKLSLPKELIFKPNVRYGVLQRNDGVIVVDGAGFSYVDDVDEPKTIVHIGVSKIQEVKGVLYEYDESQPTTLKEVKMIIGGKRLDEKTDTYEELIADFYYRGIYYRISATNITTKEYRQILEAIIE